MVYFNLQDINALISVNTCPNNEQWETILKLCKI